MPQKRSYKNPYHQTKSELAEWLALFAQQHSTTEVADALVERYPEQSTGDPKADHRLAKEAICTVNPNDSRYNAEKWAKQYRLMQANYLEEVFQSHSLLTTKALRAFNAAFDDLESTISSLSPKERVSLVPKALLTLTQAYNSIRLQVPQELKIVPVEETDDEEQSQEDTIRFLEQSSNENKAHEMLLEGKGFDEIAAETGVTEDELREKIERKKVEHEVLGMYKNGMDPDEIHQRTKLGIMYIEGIVEAATFRGMFDDVSEYHEDRPEYHKKIRARLNNENGDQLDVHSDVDRSLN